MSLNNFYFLLLFGAMLLGYWLICNIFKKKNYRGKVLTGYLLLFSGFVIAISDLRFLICVFVITVISYFVPIGYSKKWFGISKGWICAGIVTNLLFLGVFKYFNFFSEQISRVLGGDSVALKLILPIGISFYTFSAISYIMDVYKEKLKANPSFIEVALYIMFFPKLSSGPIVRAKTFFEQLSSLGTNVSANLSCGIQIFVYGCFKKMVLADHLGVFVDQVFAAPKAYHSLTVVWAVISYSLQIYFDFAGYSDMAIGISKILGFDFDWNFNFPYLAKNLTEFWKRWHISLSSWLQEYLYYSLGGNRKGRSRAYLNLVLTMLLGGFWHGASWTFVVWGLLHGIALVIHKLFMEWKIRKYGDKFYTTKLWNTVSMCLTFLYVTFCWIWFRASSIENASQVIGRILLFKEGISHPYTWTLFAVVVLGIMTIVMKKRGKCGVTMPVRIEDRYILFDLNKVKGLTVFFILCGLTLALAYYGNTVFIYGAF